MNALKTKEYVKVNSVQRHESRVEMLSEMSKDIYWRTFNFLTWHLYLNG